MIDLVKGLTLNEHELNFSAIRATGPGGQNVNKVSSAIHLRFDIKTSSLPKDLKTQLLQLRDKRITKDGVLVIKAQTYRDQEKNRLNAIERLVEIIAKASHRPKKRVATKPSRASSRRRMDKKTLHGRKKQQRRHIPDD